MTEEERWKAMGDAAQAQVRMEKGLDAEPQVLRNSLAGETTPEKSYYRPPSITERIEKQIVHENEQLVGLYRLKELSAKHPEFEELEELRNLRNRYL